MFLLCNNLRNNKNEIEISTKISINVMFVNPYIHILQKYRSRKQINMTANKVNLSMETFSQNLQKY